MFKLQVTKTCIEVLEVETLTTDARNATEVKFCFSDEWKGMTKTAFFKAGKPSREVTAYYLLNNMNTCKIPAEVLTRANVELYCGVKGNSSTRDGGDVVIPTVWVKLGDIKEGANGGDEDENISPEQYDKLLGIIGGKQDLLEGKEGQYVGFNTEGHAVAKDWPKDGGTSGGGGEGEETPTLPENLVTKTELEEYKAEQAEALDSKLSTSGGTVTGPLLFVEETSVSSNSATKRTANNESGVLFGVGGISKHTEGPLNIQTVSNHIRFADEDNMALLSRVAGDEKKLDSVPNYGQMKQAVTQAKEEISATIPENVSDLNGAEQLATKATSTRKSTRLLLAARAFLGLLARLVQMEQMVRAHTKSLLRTVFLEQKQNGLNL